MELIRGQHNLRPWHRGCVLTIGNFDGVHLGHQAVIEQLTTAAAETGLPATLMTFEPQPREFFVGDNAPARLTRLREKLQVLGATTIDRILCLRFNHSLAMLPAQVFIERLLVERLGIKRIVIGDDFRFGHNGAGNFALLQEAGQKFDFTVIKRNTYQVGGQRVSSSRIRSALAAGELATAAALLGRTYTISGRVAYGDQLGRTIGFPTANIALQRLFVPLSGVYAVRMHGIADSPLPGMANIGIRPTVGGRISRLEVHLFDFEQTIYGRHVQVEFLDKLREEQRFASLDVLKHRLCLDAEQARAFFTGAGAAPTLTTEHGQ